MPKEKPAVAAVILKSIVPSVDTLKFSGTAVNVGSFFFLAYSRPSRYVEKATLCPRFVSSSAIG